MRGFFTFALLNCLTHGSPLGQVKTPIKNMNGDYAKYEEVEYFDVYSPPISSRYGEVFWTMMDPVPLDEDIVKRFAGKTMAIVGYETDQVMKSSSGDVSVPITWAYNHHYCAYMSGALSEMKKIEAAFGINDHGMNNHGAPAFYQTLKREDLGDILADSDIPTSQFFSEGNGGEFRKSYHGYPLGMAQLIESPTTFHIQPMQIDTKNRHYNGTDFRPDLLPKASAAPPNASYSGLLECPCTDRIVKKIEQIYLTEKSGTCKTPLSNASECFEAASKVTTQGVIASNETVDSQSLPVGCSVVQNASGSAQVYFNQHSGSQIACGGGGHEFQGSFSANSSQTMTSVHLDSSSQKATITMSGPNGKWFSVGLGSPTYAMADKPYTIVVDGGGNVSE